MDTFEYNVELISSDEDFLEELQKLGANGWEVLWREERRKYAGAYHEWHVYLKRKIIKE